MALAAEKLQPTGQVVERLPFEQYVTLDGIHATSLKDMLVSPLLYRWRRQNKRADTDALRAGRAAHTAILEPDRFPVEYTVWRSSKMGRRFGKKWDAFCAMATAQGQTVLTEQQYDAAIAMRDAVRRHPVAAALLAENGKTELTVKWTHPRTGMSCVSRIDYLCSAIADLKTTKSIEPRKFAADSVRYGYPLQAGFYADGAAVAGFGALPFKFLAVQSAPPHDVAVFNVPEDVLAFGRKQYEDAIDRLLACHESNTWPGQAQSELELKLPMWAAPDFSEDAPDETAPVEDVGF